MQKNTSLVCYLAVTLLIPLSPLAYGEKQDANKPAAIERPRLAGVPPFEEIEPASLEEIKERVTGNPYLYPVKFSQ